MNRETEYSFARLPETEISRSKFDRSFNHATTFDNGDIIPIYCEHVMPSDTVNLSVSSVIRMLTPLTPVMDSLYADIMFFYIPYRLIWDNFKYFLGENKEPWKQTTDYRFPKIILHDNADHETPSKVEAGSLLNYFGIPIGLGTSNDSYNVSLAINALPLRAYCKVYNDWFKSEACEKDLYYSTGDSSTEFIGKTNFLDDFEPADAEWANRCIWGAVPAKVNREFDYFSAGLPEPQKGAQTLVPLVGEAPITMKPLPNATSSPYWEGHEPYFMVGMSPNKNASQSSISNNYTWAWNVSGIEWDVDQHFREPIKPENPIIEGTPQYLDVGLKVNLENAVGASVNAIRNAFAIQKFYERQARYGTRYGEVIQGHFNTINPDVLIQRSEYLGGKRFPLSINQVVATNTNEAEKLGETGAYSVSSDVSDDIFTKSFSEWGIILGVVCTRTHRSYQQGINRFWFMDKITDMYWPEFANLGEMPIYQKEIYAQDGSVEALESNDNVFAYQEAWSHYRYSPDMITGELASTYDQSLDIWHYGDYYETVPTLSQEWMEEGTENVKRTLAYQNGHQFKADFYFNATWTRPMPLYSIPGLVDHH